MIETNILILEGGGDLQLRGRKVAPDGEVTNPETLEKLARFLPPACAAAVAPGQGGGAPFIFAWSDAPVGPAILKGEGLELAATDRGPATLSFGDPRSRTAICRAVERAAAAEIRRRIDGWYLYGPRKIFFKRPWKSDSGIDIHRRLDISTIPIDSAGIGLVVDLSTAFMSQKSVADYFTDTPDRTRNEADFQRLTRRQMGQKGTLIYYGPRKPNVCYFVEFQDQVTCGTTRRFTIGPKTYNNLYEYYQATYPAAGVRESDTVALVSFKGLPKVPVAAKLLRLKVLGEDLPRALKELDKITPAIRRRDLAGLIDNIGEDLLGSDRPKVSTRFWSPPDGEIRLLPTPALEFGKGRILAEPRSGDGAEYRRHFNDRLRLLKNGGCFDLPGYVDRTLVFAGPESLRNDAFAGLEKDLLDWVKDTTGREFASRSLRFKDLGDAVEKLRASVPGVKVIVHDDAPGTHVRLTHELRDHRIKRITRKVLESKFAGLGDGTEKGRRSWSSFVEMCGLDVLQQLGASPWIPAQRQVFEAQLVIDVSPRRRHFGVSLQVCRPAGRNPRFRFGTIPSPKPDHQFETINPVQLRETILRVFESIPGLKGSQIESLLVLRDGDFRGDEGAAVREAARQLVVSGFLATDFRLAMVNFHKTTLKGIRAWDLGPEGARNVLEGTAIRLSQGRVVLFSTGRATLTQGTASPVILESKDSSLNLFESAADCFASSQMNWSSPRVAQRLSLGFKRTDEDLESREASEAYQLR